MADSAVRKTVVTNLFINILLQYSVQPLILYENIDQKLQIKLHGPLHYKIGDTGIYNGHVFYTLL